MIYEESYLQLLKKADAYWEEKRTGRLDSEPALLRDTVYLSVNQ